MDLGLPIQPITDIPTYLDSRSPTPHFSQELTLFITLPDALRAELRAQLGKAIGHGAFGAIQRHIKGRLSVAQSCALVYPDYRSQLACSLKHFRARFDAWRKSGDWLTLVNRSKAGALWQKRPATLPEAFLNFAESRVSRFKRMDGKRQAVFSIHRQWQTGRNPHGAEEPIPGYETGWTQRNRALLPDGWSYSNILDRLHARHRLTHSVTAMIQIGTAAATAFLPHHLSTRAGLRFLELVTFDDVRTDWLIFDDAAGQVCELWLLVARDHATAMVLGFVMHPCLVRPDGTVTHLGLKQMKQLAAWLLERYPLPPYVSTWKVERGTATIAPGDAAALAEMLPGHIKLSYTSMIGGTSPAGYTEKKKGNSRGKASHESHNRLFHTQGSFIPGQTGNRWDIRPADLAARSAEAVEVWALRNRLPEHLRGAEQYPLLLPAQAREHLVRICLEQNFRTDHDLEDFDKVLEWYDDQTKQWQPQSSYSPLRTPHSAFRTRKEMPVERAIKLMAPYAGQWTKCSPDILIAFLSHTIRKVTFKDNGEITFTHDGSPLTFCPPTINHQLPQLSTALAYFHPDDPSFLHVTDGQGRTLGSWYRRARVGFHQQELLEQAMRYTSAALKQAQAVAAELLAPESADLAAMRLHNAELDRGNEFQDVAGSQVSALKSEISNLKSPVASALAGIPATRAALNTERKQQAEAGRAAADDLLQALSASEQ